MLILILGVLLWALAHLFKFIAPEARARMGEKGKGPIAIALLLSVVLMVIGYRAADGAFYWGRSPAMTGINNLLVLVAFYLFAASGMKTRVTRLTRHPQLIGFSLWCVGHLLVNGDTPSFVLWGGLLAWAIVTMVLINRTEPAWTPPEPAPNRKEIMAIVGGVVVFAVVAVIHMLLGYNPFG
ncbi:NnrU family protein [Heliomarina baculiformis]|uniref:NnrU family protein n=1 Tax=Heliomarina baculiformis TaxID=2872036 RepID=UPI001EE280BE|nr:NnrU family protein [Heliomarina baculiformis]